MTTPELSLRATALGSDHRPLRGLHFRFPLSFREVDELAFGRGVVVNYATMRGCYAKLGSAYSSQLRCGRAGLGDTRHLDEAFIRISAAQRYLWCAVDQLGDVLDVPIQSRRNALAASGFFRKLSRLKYVPRVIVSDKLESYQVAHRDALASVKHNAIPVLEQLGRTRTQPT